MNEQQPYITVIYTLADGKKIQVEVTLDVAAVLRETDNKLLALLKQDKRYIDFTELDGCEGKLLYAPEGPDDMVERLEGYAQLHKALDSLTAVQRRRVKARFFGEQSYTEIARREGVRESAVRSSVNNALKKLQKILDGGCESGE